jgi:hypothetical protein
MSYPTADAIPDEIPCVYIWHEGASLMTNTAFGQLCLVPGVWEYVTPAETSNGGASTNYFGAVRVRHG